MRVKEFDHETGYREVREDLASQYNLGNREPNIQVYNVNVRGDRSLTLRHYMHNQQPLGDSTNEVLRHIHRLWGFDIHLESVQPDGTVSKSYHCPELITEGQTESLI
jgi:stage V sporulation protein R